MADDVERRTLSEGAGRQLANATKTHGAAATLVAGQADAVAFGKLFIANPDYHAASR